MIRWIFLMGLTYVAYGIHINFIDCGPVYSYMAEEVFLDVTCKKEPCFLYMKRQTNLTVTFKSNHIVAEDLTAESYMTVGGHKQKIEITPIKCPTHVCPILANESKKFSVLLKPNFIAPNYPVAIFLELYNKKHEKLVCVSFKALIVDPDKKYLWRTIAY